MGTSNQLMPNPSIHRTLRDEAAQRPVISNVEAYLEAFSLYSMGRSDEARVVMEAFQKKYPQS